VLQHGRGYRKEVPRTPPRVLLHGWSNRKEAPRSGDAGPKRGLPAQVFRRSAGMGAMPFGTSSNFLVGRWGVVARELEALGA